MYAELATVYDRLMAGVSYPKWAAYLLRIIRRAGGLPDGLSIVDAACGTGGIALELKKQGHCVTGLDLSEAMLMAAAEKARLAGLKLPFVRQDICALALHRPVDVITCSCDGVNYLLGEDEARDFFVSAYHALLPGGLLLFDISTEYKLRHVLGCHTFGEDLDDVAYLWRNCYDPLSRLLEMDLTFFFQDPPGRFQSARKADPALGGQPRSPAFRRARETHRQRAHRPDELAQWLHDAGFEQTDIFSWNTFLPPKETDERIQFSARKPA